MDHRPEHEFGEDALTEWRNICSKSENSNRRVISNNKGACHMNDVYQQLAKKLDEMPNGYPATESGVELKILRKIFTPDEAEFWLKLKPIPETAEAIAERLGAPLGEIQSKLDNMVLRGEIASAKIFDNQV